MNLCKICGKQLPEHRQLYCSDECAKAGELQRSRDRGRNGKPRHGWDQRLIACADCGKPIRAYAKTFRCEDCQHAADLKHDREHRQRAAAGHARKIGDTYTCERCGEPYILRGGKQKYCARCAELAAYEKNRDGAREYARQHPRTKEQKEARHKPMIQKVCPACGQTFWTNNSRKISCSAKCAQKTWKENWRMTNHQFHILWTDALKSEDRTDYINEWALSSMWGEDPENEISAETINAIARIWDAAHMDLRAIWKQSGMTQAEFADALCIPKRTVEDWVTGAHLPPDYVRLLILKTFDLV